MQRVGMSVIGRSGALVLNWSGASGLLHAALIPIMPLTLGDYRYQSAKGNDGVQSPKRRIVPMLPWTTVDCKQWNDHVVFVRKLTRCAKPWYEGISRTALLNSHSLLFLPAQCRSENSCRTIVYS